jgi:HAD superfamily hydrolase (TIGR01509 family)
VRAVVLDAGGVVLYPNLDWIAARAALIDQHKLTRDQLFLAYYRTIAEVDLTESPIGGRGGPALTSLEIRVWFFSHLLAHAGLPRAALAGRRLAEQAQECFPRESDIYHWAMPGVREQLEGLRRAGYLLGMASNNDGALRDQLRSVGIDDLFSPAALMDSGVEGVAKPDPELPLRAARALGVTPASCLFVGDVDRVDGAAARAAGMPFALLDPLGQERPARPLVIGSLAEIEEHFVALED